jgi:hypothetical protein
VAAASDARSQGPAPTARPAQARVLNAGDAERLVGAILATMAALEKLLDQETSLMRDGRIADALASERTKNELAGTYLRQLETLKANAIALARFAPGVLESLKASHKRFAGVIETNQAVLATARAVSEGLIRSLSEEVDAKSRPTTYGGNRQMTAPSSTAASPLVLSKRL